MGDEVVGLLWDHVFRRDGEIRLGRTKNGDLLTIPLEGRVAVILERRVYARLQSDLTPFHTDLTS